MFNAARTTFLVAFFAAVVPVVVSDRLQAGNHHCSCRICRQPCGSCTCPAPACPVVVPQTTFQPVIETQYAQQPVLQQRDILATEYRTEPVLETVPATVVENVTIDEGSFQTVWVPRLTTRAVARTTYQSRLSYHTVPYQVSRRISEYATQTVPYQTVRYIPTTTGSTLAHGTTPGLSTALLPPDYSGSPVMGGAYPTLAAAPAYPTPIDSSSITSSSGHVPDARYADAPVTPITPRNSSISRGYTDTRSADRGASLFVPAPSAAQVWRTPRNAMR